ncbi:MAG: helicase-related protein, partial [Planctomycetota bacterium]|nr:helicase-related protein [Planctomycetota bacterium]
RIGISATQKPIERIAQYLMESEGRTCEIINIGHQRNSDLAIELPASPLTAVMANEVWEEIHRKIEALIRAHRTTLIFVPTRAMAERLSHHLSMEVGEDVVSAHHGSMSKDKRLDAETRLKEGSLRCLVATASLELGIDIGSIDLVCQIGSPKSISAFLQRVGRSGHTLTGVPKGRIFPLNKDELVEAAAIVYSVRQGELDALEIPERPLDVLSQQVVAEVSCEDYSTDDLYDLVTRSFAYRNLTRNDFDRIIRMLTEGFTFGRGGRRAYLHYNPISKEVKARKGARLTATVSGGTIPDQFDYDVVLEPSGAVIGSVHEDFAIESLPGDIFQLGNAAWKILKVETGKVRVKDAQGSPPTMPFWLGEAPSRSSELSLAVSHIRESVANRINLDEVVPNENAWKTSAMRWTQEEIGIED